jgi:L-rhamnose mutarotase
METVDAFNPAVDFPRHLEMSPKCVEWGQARRTLQPKTNNAR